MLRKLNDFTYQLVVGEKTIIIEILRSGSIEIYEEENPSKTGFIFNNINQFTFFINNITDIAESVLEEMNENR